jgi:hypothetical protein
MQAEPTQSAVARILELFRGHERVFAVQKADGRYSPSRPERDLTEADVLAHLHGEATYGVYPLRRDNTCSFICFDLDLRKPPSGIDGGLLAQAKMPLAVQVCTLLDTLADEAQMAEASTLVEDTGGTRVPRLGPVHRTGGGARSEATGLRDPGQGRH